MDFEDLVLLQLPDNVSNTYNTSNIFASDKTTRGIARQRIAEGALLYKYAKRKKDSTVLEIGTKFGGSSIIIAAALDNGIVYTVDKDITIYAKNNSRLFKDKIVLIHSESSKVEWDRRIGLLHIDGMNTANAVIDDFKKFSPFVECHGYVLVHNIVVKGKRILDGFLHGLEMTGQWKICERADESVVIICLHHQIDTDAPVLE